MRFLDFFNKETKPKETSQNTNDNFVIDGITTPTSQAPVSIFKPTSFSDVEKIIDSLKAGKNSIVHLTAVKPETAIRILDLLSGAVYALSGGVYEMEKNIFMFSPSGVEVYR